jgi:hypothetical protein
MRHWRNRWSLGVVALLTALVVSVSVRAQKQDPNVPRPAVSASSLFTHSENCVACHNNLSTASGEDVSIGAAWGSTIMANSARDPYFLASVRRETVDHGSRSADIQDECAACHVPAAQKSAHAAGRLATILDPNHQASSDEEHRIARDGVSCTVCHQIASDALGSPESFNGNFRMHPSRPDGVRDVFGPFAVDQGRRSIMRSVTGFEQAEAPHVRQSELCATCHTLITKALDREGRVIGSLPEQMNYQEWRHSAFYSEGKSCQSCHMPRTTGPTRVSSVLGAERDGLSRHAFVGGNAFMLRMLNRYRNLLNVTAPGPELEGTARLTERQLQSETATIALSTPQRVGTRLEFDVTVRNLTGHKFPTGYPSRRAWLHVTVGDDDGRTLFESGGVSADASIRGNDADRDAATFEEHYDVIEREDQVQVYESVLGDVAQRPTTGLLSAVRYLKDNRLLPRGFDKKTADAQIAVVGSAGNDATFTGGSDTVHYRITVARPEQVARVDVVLLYQPIGFRWAHNLNGYGSPETAQFVEFFTSMAPSASTVVASVSWAK